MKTIYGYLILLISFSGLIYLKQSATNRAPASQNYFNSNSNIDSKIRKRIVKLENVVDSLMVQNSEFQTDGNNSPVDKIPLLAPTPQITIVEPKQPKIMKDVFLTLNDAAKVRDSRTRLSLIAQEYINLAYEMGGDSWYGAEKVWGTDAFKNRVNELHEDDG
tara:strand:+ start:191 stop:676 length:486 start_codon:yes stop_codon:yes gene_type:complete